MKQRYVLTVDYAKCTGCRLCETVCTLGHEGRVAPSQARISVVKEEEAGVDVPVFCQQCERPVCVEVCPAGALAKDEETGVVRVDQDRCLGCMLCLMSCPMGGMVFGPGKGAQKCDLCDGDPLCARYCPTGALQFVPLAQAHLRGRRNMALKAIGLDAGGDPHDR